MADQIDINAGRCVANMTRRTGQPHTMSNPSDFDNDGDAGRDTDNDGDGGTWTTPVAQLKRRS